MLILKLVFLNVLWLIVVKYGQQDIGRLFLPVALVTSIINFYIFKPKIEFRKYILLLVFMTLWGLIQDGLLYQFGAIKGKEYPLWTVSLWVIFVCYYGDVFNRFNKFSSVHLSLIGAFAGTFAYWGGVQQSDMVVNTIIFYPAIFLSWLIFFPLSIKLAYRYSFLDLLLDKSIIFSFDKSGYKRHAQFFKSDDISLEGKTILVTGGTSGIGLSCARDLNKLGANLIVTGRNLQKGEQAQKEGLRFIPMDLVNWDDFTLNVDKLDKLDHVILNAGAMPDELVLNKYGVESQLASQLIGHYKLISMLRKKNKLKTNCRIIWVSSGGMYLQKLDVDELFSNLNYDKVSTYAMVKRAQVTLVEELSNDKDWEGVYHLSMHPGWVRTDGLTNALPGFTKFMSTQLRAPHEGADTIVWLTYSKEVQNGAFYFDRKAVSAYVNESYKPDTLSRDDLVKRVKLL